MIRVEIYITESTESPVEMCEAVLSIIARYYAMHLKQPVTGMELYE